MSESEYKTVSKNSVDTASGFDIKKDDGDHGVETDYTLLSMADLKKLCAAASIQIVPSMRRENLIELLQCQPIQDLPLQRRELVHTLKKTLDKKSMSSSIPAEDNSKSAELESSDGSYSEDEYPMRRFIERASNNTHFTYITSNGETMLFCIMPHTNELCVTDSGASEMKTIVSTPVKSFYLNQKNKRIFYRTNKNRLFACDYSGKNNQLICGDNGDEVVFYTLNDDYLYFLAKNPKDKRVLYRMTTDLSEMTVLIADAYDICHLTANETYFCYLDSKISTAKLICQDIATGKERVLLSDIGISFPQVYKNYVVFETFTDVSSLSYKYRHIEIINIETGQRASLTQAHVTEINCYLDHVFYVDHQTKNIWCMPLTSGEPSLVCDSPSSSVDVVSAGRGVGISRLDLETNNFTEPLIFTGLSVTTGKAMAYSCDRASASSKTKTAPVSSNPSKTVHNQQSNAQTSSIPQSKQTKSKIDPTMKKMFQSEISDAWKKEPVNLFLANMAKVATTFLGQFLFYKSMNTVGGGWLPIVLGVVGAFIAFCIYCKALQAVQSSEIKKLEKEYVQEGGSYLVGPPGLSGLKYAIIFILLLGVASQLT